MRNGWVILSLWLVSGAAAWAAPPGQWFGSAPGVPVDQAVADIDPLATSLRRVETGLRQDGEQTSLYRVDALPVIPDYDRPNYVRVGLATRVPVYYRVGPGFRARVERLDYLIKTGRKSWALNITPPRDGQFVELAPLGTVYELTPEPMVRHVPVLPPPAAQVDLRRDARINARVDGRSRAMIEARVDGQLLPVQ